MTFDQHVMAVVGPALRTAPAPLLTPTRELIMSRKAVLRNVANAFIEQREIEPEPAVRAVEAVVGLTGDYLFDTVGGTLVAVFAASGLLGVSPPLLAHLSH